MIFRHDASIFVTLYLSNRVPPAKIVRKFPSAGVCAYVEIVCFFLRFRVYLLIFILFCFFQLRSICFRLLRISAISGQSIRNKHDNFRMNPYLIPLLLLTQSQSVITRDRDSTVVYPGRKSRRKKLISTFTRVPTKGPLPTPMWSYSSLIDLRPYQILLG